MKMGFSLIGELDTSSWRKRNWNRVLKDLKKRAFQIEKKKEWEFRGSIRLEIFGVLICATGRSWAILHNEAGKKSQRIWSARQAPLVTCLPWVALPASSSRTVATLPWHNSGRNNPKGVSFNVSFEEECYQWAIGYSLERYNQCIDILFTHMNSKTTKKYVY